MPRTSHWQIEHHSVVDSTNRLGAERVRACWDRNESAAGIGIVSDRQSAGRGQHGRTWESPTGGLYLSAIIEDIPPTDRSHMALMAGVAVGDALIHGENIPAQLRWPNDLVVGGKKIAGILCDSLAQGDRWACVIGIGLNVNSTADDFPLALRPYATSLRRYDSRARDLSAILATVLDSLSHTFQSLRREGFARILARVRELDALDGHAIHLCDGDHDFHGQAAGIGENGEFLLGVDGNVQAFTHASILSVDGFPIRPPLPASDGKNPK